MSKKRDYVVTPFTVVIDSREQFPFGFTGYTADSKRWYRSPGGEVFKPPLIVPVEVNSLSTGDYSIKGFENRVAVERKSLADAYGTFNPKSEDGARRQRFEDELKRLSDMEFGAVVVEASWASAINSPPEFTEFTPKSFYRTVVAWQVRFRNVQWLFADTRSFAERSTLRWLERFWLDDQRRMKEAG